MARPHVVAHVAVGLDGATRGFGPDLAERHGAGLVWLRYDITYPADD